MNAPDPLARAAAALRQHTDTGWVQVRTGVLASALGAFRPSAPVRATHDLGHFFVASDVLVTRVRESVDAVRSAAAERITATTDDADDLQRLLVQIVAAYGTPLLEVAAQVREAASREVAAVLGAPRAPALIEIDVHIGDVTKDPHRL